jgi:hypothetical protein
MAQGGRSHDGTKAKKLLGFEPIYNMEKSIGNIKEWVDSGGLEEEAIALEPVVRSRCGKHCR